MPSSRQLEIDFTALPAPAVEWKVAPSRGKAPKPSIDERFAVWMAGNEPFVRLFCARALKLQREGWQHHSTDHLCAALRYEKRRDEALCSNWSDHYSSRLAREAISRYPSLSTFFELRALKAQTSEQS